MAQEDESGKEKESDTRSLPVRPLSPVEELDRLFEDFFGQRWPRAWMRPFRFEHPTWADLTAGLGKSPRVDVVDGATEIVVRAEVPGVAREDLDVSISEDTVTIRGHSHREEKIEAASYYRAEISRGEFARTIALPSAVDASKARAKLENGILEITLPKVEKAKRHSIKVE
ncbi:MAG: Hsp20/alpha crystallin family protein [Thiohalomonadaceae bacterium]